MKAEERNELIQLRTEKINIEELCNCFNEIDEIPDEAKLSPLAEKVFSVISDVQNQNRELKKRLFNAIYRLDEVWEAPEISGDIISFWPDWLKSEHECQADWDEKDNL